jgi:NADH:ubiquinone oxidoreductase subunit 3 (subunit A)
MEYALSGVVAVYTIVGLLMLGVVILLSWCVRPLRQRQRAQETYECGFPAQGDARSIGFNYMQYAALFLVFDIAALFLFLYAVSSRPADVTIGFFLGLGLLGLMILYGTRPRRYHAT